MDTWKCIIILLIEGYAVASVYFIHTVSFVYRKLKLRQEAVSELVSNGSPSVSMLRDSILHLPDLERMLCSAYHKKVHVLVFDNRGPTLAI